MTTAASDWQWALIWRRIGVAHAIRMAGRRHHKLGNRNRNNDLSPV